MKSVFFVVKNEFFVILASASIIEVRFWDIWRAVVCRYNTIFSKITTKDPIVRSSGRVMGYLLCVQTYAWQIGPFWQDTLDIWVMLQSLRCYMQLHVILDCTLIQHIHSTRITSDNRIEHHFLINIFGWLACNVIHQYMLRAWQLPRVAVNCL